MSYFQEFLVYSSVLFRNYTVLLLLCAGVSSGQFEDEICEDLKHTGAGIFSMANRYTNTQRA